MSTLEVLRRVQEHVRNGFRWSNIAPSLGIPLCAMPDCINFVVGEPKLKNCVAATGGFWRSPIQVVVSLGIWLQMLWRPTGDSRLADLTLRVTQIVNSWNRRSSPQAQTQRAATQR